MNNIIEVTESAQNHINKILLSEKSNYFRITVLGGGCAGFQYKFDFDNVKNIGITASASSPEILVKKLLDKLKNNFEININEAHYQKEDVFFKVPQKLNV